MNPRVVSRWRKRPTVEDMKTEPSEPRSTVLTDAEEPLSRSGAARCRRWTTAPTPYGHQSRIWPARRCSVLTAAWRLAIARCKGRQADLLGRSFLRQHSPLSPPSPAHANDFGLAEGREAVHECDTYPDFFGLAFGVSCRFAFSKDFQAAHLCIDPAAGAVSRPALPDHPAIVPGGAQGFVLGDCGWAILFLRSPVLVVRNMAVACRSLIAVWQRRVP